MIHLSSKEKRELLNIVRSINPISDNVQDYFLKLYSLNHDHLKKHGSHDLQDNKKKRYKKYHKQLRQLQHGDIVLCKLWGITNMSTGVVVHSKNDHVDIMLIGGKWDGEQKIIMHRSVNEFVFRVI